MADEKKKDVAEPLMADATNNKPAVVDDVEAGKEVVYKKDVEEVQVVVPEKFIGLTKEELERYRDDPFWKKLRWFLFVLFWLAWIAMFVAAIAIVATSEGCPPKNYPKWFQRNLAYRFWIPSFFDSDNDGLGDIQGAGEKLEDLERIYVQSVHPAPFLACNDFDPAKVVSYTEGQPNLSKESKTAAADFVDSVVGKGMRFILDLSITTTSNDHDWFKKSVKNEEGYKDVYVWGGRTGGAYFTENSDRGQQYFHYRDNEKMPVLNYDGEDIAPRMKEVLEKWIEKGVTGFNLPNLEYLGRTGASVDQAKIKETLKTFRTWIEEAKNNTDKADAEIAIFTRRPKKDAQPIAFYNELLDEGYIDVLDGQSGMADLTKADADTVHAAISKVIDSKNGVVEVNGTAWPSWELGNAQTKRVASRVGGKKAAECLEMLMLLLPGPFLNYYGDELPMIDVANPEGNEKGQQGVMQWSGDANAGFSESKKLKVPGPAEDYKTNNFKAQGSGYTSRKMFTRLASLRDKDETLMKGNTTLGKPQKGYFTVLRVGGGDKTYFGVFNFKNSTQKVDLTKEFKDDLSEEALKKPAQVVALTSTFKGKGAREGIDLGEVEMSPLSAVVIRN